MEGISIGPIFLRWNGILIMSAFLIGGLLASRDAKRRGYDPEFVLDLVFPLLIWGTIGARLWHVFTPPLSSSQLGLTTGYYLTHPLDLLAIWVGGLGFPGALLGGMLGLLLFCRKNELSFGEWADILAPVLALGQAIGRPGNYFNQELYGLPAHVPWQIFISPEHRLAGYESVDFYHPLFAYEVILNLVNVFVLIVLSRRFSDKLSNGSLFLIYLFNYGIIRFLLEYLRLDVALIAGVNINQIFAAILLLVSGILLYLRNRAPQKL
jgi:phosphatidylglycerol:prolipoprotein diacylglycerol transferase